MKNAIRENNKYEEWYKEINHKKVLHVVINARKEILELQNFFLICQRAKKEGIRGKFTLSVTCKQEDEYRIRHYLYLAKNYPNIEKIVINGKRLSKIGDVFFFHRVPLLLVDKEMYEFLGTRIEEIAKNYDEESFLCKGMEEKVWKRVQENEKDVKALLVKLCINNLIGEVDTGTKVFSCLRREYFLNNKFYVKIKDMPFLACMILSISVRAQNIDAIQDKKTEIRDKRKIEKAYITKDLFGEVFFDENEIESEIFNAWDISEGILQLIENIVLHAGSVDEKSSKPIGDGEGVFTMCLQKNDVEKTEDGKEFNQSSELYQSYTQYFRGYLNEYREGDFDEGNALKTNREKLLNELVLGQYVDGELLYNYDNVRHEIEKRRKERRKVKFFLEIQMADFSGQYMCDVFRENLSRRQDPHREKFENMSVRTFFDPAIEREINGIIVREKENWSSYYKGKNAIQHFGLQIFLSIVSDNSGCFDVKSFKSDSLYCDFYSNTGDKDTSINMLPGTRYNILLPMKNSSKIKETQNTFLNTDINYKFLELSDLKQNEDTKDIVEEFYNKLGEITVEPESKAVVIESLKEILDKIHKDNKIIIFDGSLIKGALQFEIFAKTIIFLCACEENRDCYNNIAIINCNTNNFVKFIRYFSIYYDKDGNCEWMTHKQIYLCGQNSIEEFIVSGKNLQEMLGRVEKLAFSRRLNPNCLPMLTRMLQKRTGKGSIKHESEEEFKYTPFDLIIQNNGNQTIFEQNVLSVLEENIQKVQSGCKIEPTHMRIGSKIHMHAFYEAELLFFNNYYVNRFAYLLAERIYNLQIDWERPLWIIGYEAYSEMLICRLKQYLDEGKVCTNSTEIYYSIYENSRGSISNIEENFRYFNLSKVSELIENKAQVLFVVPINSTLTTFSKLEIVVGKKLKDIGLNDALDIVSYLGIIQVRDINNGSSDRTKAEKKYWDELNIEQKYVVSKKLLNSKEQKAYYLILTQAKWEEPLKCSKCYPEDCLLETPLIETDRTSVVPTQLIGLQKNNDSLIPNLKYNYASAGDIKSINNYFYFDHVERGSNHYQIYIRTANYFTDYKNDVEEWLRNTVKRKIHEQKKGALLSFDVLVNPLHFSNAAFVEAVNEVVFNGASYTLRIEVEKEFRDNVETKFSDLQLLYEKLNQMKIAAEINIHYVDDSINLGGNYTRMKHVVSSLFPHSAVQGKECVKVNIFKNVIVLLNRMSASSICDYVSDINHYFYYLDLRISSMRTHEDACYLCKEESNSEKISEASGTNQMSVYWEEQKKKFKKKSLHEAKKYKEKMEKKGERYYQRCYRRIICAHRLNTELAGLGEGINKPLVVLQKVVDLILSENNNEFVEFLMGYLYAYATPFICYRKSAREGAFTLVITMLEWLLLNADAKTLKTRIETLEQTDDKREQIQFVVSCIQNVDPLIKKLKRVSLNGNQKYDLLKFLMKLSADLKGNYILREDRIAKIENFAENYVTKESLDDFNLYYVALMKKILTLNGDESKSARFDDTLVQNWKTVFEECKNKEAATNLLVTMYLENTVGIRGIVNSLDCLNEKGDFKSFYTDENYKHILVTNGVEECRKFLLELRNLNSLFVDSDSRYDASNIENIPFYEKLCVHIGRLLEVESVCCAVKTFEQMLKINEESKVIYSDEITYKVFGKYEENIRDSITEKIKQIDEINETCLLDTVFYDSQEKIAFIKYKITLGEEKDNNVKEVYLGIQFVSGDTKEIIQKLKIILLFRHKIMSKLSNDFDNNILQEWIEKNRILEQLRKARANSHTDEGNCFDENSVWTLSERFLFGDDKEKAEHMKNHESKMLGCILGLMMNIRIGRSNVLILSKGEFTLEELYGKQKFSHMRNYILAMKNIYFYDRLRILDQNKNEIGDNIFTEDIYNSIMEKGKDGFYCNFRDYLLYFIFEIFHSAAVNGREDGRKVSVIVYRDNEYLMFKNYVKKTFSKENIEKGLRREEAGISLATICEFFIYNYEERYVKLLIDEETFTIGLPLFTTEEGDV